MRWASFFLCLLALATACVVEDKPVVPPIEGGVEAGVCVLCPEDTPVCLNDTECVQCTMDEQQYCTDRDQVCDVENHECVDCLSNAECTDPDTSRCDTDDNECAPCETNEDCDGVDGLAESGNACDADKVCVECTPETEAETCPNDKSCNPRTKTCTETTVGSRGVCETCVADSECGDRAGAGGRLQVCPDVLTRRGALPGCTIGFCLKTIDWWLLSRPYRDHVVRSRNELSAPQLDGDYCGINELLTTCPAVARARRG